MADNVVRRGSVGTVQSIPGNISGTFKSFSSHVVQPVGVNIVDIIYKFGLEDYASWNAHERERYLEELDPFELLEAVNEVTSELATLQTENHFLNAFLQKNDPKLLIGLRRKPPQPGVGNMTNRSQRLSGLSKSSRVSATSYSTVKLSQSQPSSIGRKQAPEYNLNCKAKADLIDMATLEMEKNLMESEANVEQELKIANAHVEELRRGSADDIQTEQNYILHFMSTPEELLSSQKSPAALVLKFRKFITHWLKTADGMLDQINLNISNLRDRSQNLRRDIIVKTEMSQFATEIEFEKMVIFQNDLLNTAKDQLMQKNGLKTTAHRTSYTLTTLTKEFDNLRRVMNAMQERSTETKRQLLKLEKDIKEIEASNVKDRAKLETMAKRFDSYRAPSVDEYMRVKLQHTTLNKEESVLVRKMTILNMKLKNVQHKLNKAHKRT